MSRPVPLERIGGGPLGVATALIDQLLDPNDSGTSVSALELSPAQTEDLIQVVRQEIDRRGLGNRMVAHVRGDSQVEVLSIEITPEVERLAEKVMGRLDGGELSVFVFIEDFLAGAADSVRFPVRVLFDMLEGDRLLPDGSLASANYEAERGGSDRISVALLRKVIRDRGLEDRVLVVMYDGYDVRLERTGEVGSFIMDPETGLRLGSGVVYPLEDIFLTHWWTVLEDGDDEEYFPFRYLLSKLADDVDDMAALVEGYAETGGLDRKVFEDLSTWVGSRKRGREFQVRYHGDWDVRTHRLDRATGGAATAATSTGTPKKVAQPKPKPKPKPAVKTPQVDSGDPIPDEQYEWMVKQVIHRGFRRMGFELDEGDADPEMVKRGLERTIAELGEQSRLTVKVESPGCVAVRMKGGHKEPLRLPKKLGLARWEQEINEFVFADEDLDEHLIEPRGVSLDEALERTTAAVKAMELEDMLTLDTSGGRVRVRRTRDIHADDAPHTSVVDHGTPPAVADHIEPDSRAGSKPYQSDDFLNEVIDNFIAEDANSYRFPIHHFADLFWGDEVVERFEGFENHGGVGSGFRYALERVLRERGLESEVAVGLYGDRDVRLERPLDRRMPAKPLVPAPDGFLHLTPNKILAVDDFVIEFYWNLQESGDEAAEFPLEDFIERVYGEHRDFYVEQASRLAGGIDWMVFRVLDNFITKRDTSDRYLVRYYGRDIVWVETVDGAKECHRVAWDISTLLHENADDPTHNALGMTLAAGVDAEDYAWELRQEIEERGMEGPLWVEVVDAQHLDINYNSKTLERDALFGDDLDDLDEETVLVRDFLGSGEASRTLRTGLSRRNTRRQMAKISSAAIDLGELDRLGLSCRSGSITLSRLEAAQP